MLLRIHDNPDADLDELAGRLHLPPASLTPLISALAERGLVTPQAPGDGGTPAPAGAIALTSAGAAAASSLVTARRDALRDFVQDWDPDDHAELAQLVTRLARDLIQEPAPVS